MRISDWSSDVCSSDLDQKAEWSLSFVQEGAPPRKITVDDANGIAKSGSAREQGETTARLMRRIHDGTGMGLLWQVIIFLGGILPAILAVTGIIMWWRARQWRSSVQQRQEAKRADRKSTRLNSSP